MVSPCKKKKEKTSNEPTKNGLGSRRLRSSKPLSDKKFYLDIKNHTSLRQIEEKLTSLGARLELFLIKDVDYVVTDRDDYPRHARLLNVVTPSPFCSVSPATNSSADGVISKRTRSRAEAMLERVRQQPQKYTVDILDKAIAWHIPVYSLSKFLVWLERLISKGKKSGSTRELRGHYLKIETGGGRPDFRQFQAWPQISFSEDQPAAFPPPTPLSKHDPQRMTRKVGKTGKDSSSSARGGNGYCEICRVHYDQLDSHISSSQHVKLVSDPAQYSHLDSLISHHDLGNVSSLRKSLRLGKSPSVEMGSKHSSPPPSLNGHITRSKSDKVLCNGLSPIEKKKKDSRDAVSNHMEREQKEKEKEPKEKDVSREVDRIAFGLRSSIRSDDKGSPSMRCSNTRDEEKSNLGLRSASRDVHKNNLSLRSISRDEGSKSASRGEDKLGMGLRSSSRDEEKGNLGLNTSSREEDKRYFGLRSVSRDEDKVYQGLRSANREDDKVNHNRHSIPHDDDKRKHIGLRSGSRDEDTLCSRSSSKDEEDKGYAGIRSASRDEEKVYKGLRSAFRDEEKKYQGLRSGSRDDDKGYHGVRPTPRDEEKGCQGLRSTPRDNDKSCHVIRSGPREEEKGYLSLRSSHREEDKAHQGSRSVTRDDDKGYKILRSAASRDEDKNYQGLRSATREEKGFKEVRSPSGDKDDDSRPSTRDKDKAYKSSRSVSRDEDKGYKGLRSSTREEDKGIKIKVSRDEDKGFQGLRSAHQEEDKGIKELQTPTRVQDEDLKSVRCDEEKGYKGLRSASRNEDKGYKGLRSGSRDEDKSSKDFQTPTRDKDGELRSPSWDEDKGHKGSRYASKVYKGLRSASRDEDKSYHGSRSSPRDDDKSPKDINTLPRDKGEDLRSPQWDEDKVYKGLRSVSRSEDRGHKGVRSTPREDDKGFKDFQTPSRGKYEDSRPLQYEEDKGGLCSASRNKGGKGLRSASREEDKGFTDLSSPSRDEERGHKSLRSLSKHEDKGYRGFRSTSREEDKVFKDFRSPSREKDDEIQSPPWDEDKGHRGLRSASRNEEKAHKGLNSLSRGEAKDYKDFRSTSLDEDKNLRSTTKDEHKSKFVAKDEDRVVRPIIQEEDKESRLGSRDEYCKLKSSSLNEDKSFKSQEEIKGLGSVTCDEDKAYQVVKSLSRAEDKESFGLRIIPKKEEKVSPVSRTEVLSENKEGNQCSRPAVHEEEKGRSSHGSKHFSSKQSSSAPAPKRNRLSRKRLSVEEKLIEDNKSYYKVEVLNSKLRSTEYFISQKQLEARVNGVDAQVNGCLEKIEEKEEVKEPVVVRFKKVRKTQLAVLSDEAENFMFGDLTRKEMEAKEDSDSSEDSGQRADSDSSSEDDTPRIKKKRKLSTSPGSSSPEIRDENSSSFGDEKSDDEEDQTKDMRLEDLTFTFENPRLNEPWMDSYKPDKKQSGYYVPHYHEYPSVLLPYQYPYSERLKLMQGKKLPGFGRRRDRFSKLIEDGKPRKSPRCHASTLAIMSSLMRRRPMRECASNLDFTYEEESRSSFPETVESSSSASEVRQGSVIHDPSLLPVDPSGDIYAIALARLVSGETSTFEVPPGPCLPVDPQLFNDPPPPITFLPPPGLDVPLMDLIDPDPPAHLQHKLLDFEFKFGTDFDTASDCSDLLFGFGDDGRGISGRRRKRKRNMTGWPLGRPRKKVLKQKDDSSMMMSSCEFQIEQMCPEMAEVMSGGPSFADEGVTLPVIPLKRGRGRPRKYPLLIPPSAFASPMSSPKTLPKKKCVERFTIGPIQSCVK